LTTAGYDLDDRLTSLSVNNGASPVSSLAYAYADNLNLTGITDGVVAANSNVLSYAPANRLAAASGPWGTNSFTYDGVGNRLTDVTPTQNRIATYPLTSNRLTSITQNAMAFRSYTYDGAGNTLTDVRPGESFAFTYNKRNRLSAVTRNTLAYATYGYNALEQLTTRSTTQAATNRQMQAAWSICDASVAQGLAQNK
jgi:YD repeat-containing protein